MKKILFLCGFLIVISESINASKIAGMVNGIEITITEADSALQQLSKDENASWKKLHDEGKIKLIQMMAPSKLVESVSIKELSKEEKESALATIWMQKEIAKVIITNKEAKKGYNKLIKLAKKMKSKQKLPTFDMARESIKMQLAQEKILKSLLKKAKIRLK